MSSSRHPIALRIERRVGGASRLLATVMALPLVDGVFAALVLAGALSTVAGVLEVGLLIFGGSATVAVVLAEMDGSARQRAAAVALVGAVLIPAAVVEAALAPTIRAVLDVALFERFAGLVILAIAARTVSARIGTYLPRPAVVIALGLVASVDPVGATLVLDANPATMLRAGAAAGVGVAFALAVAVASPWLHEAVDIDRFRFGSAVALGVLPLNLFGLLPGDPPLALAVLAVTMVLSFDPDRARERDDEAFDPDPIDVTAAFADGGASQGVAHDDPDSEPYRAVDRDPVDGEDVPEDERLPWL